MTWEGRLWVHFHSNVSLWRSTEFVTQTRRWNASLRHGKNCRKQKPRVWQLSTDNTHDPHGICSQVLEGHLGITGTDLKGLYNLLVPDPTQQQARPESLLCDSAMFESAFPTHYQVSRVWLVTQTKAAAAAAVPLWLNLGGLHFAAV